jgi:hypothetical protein
MSVRDEDDEEEEMNDELKKSTKRAGKGAALQIRGHAVR